MTEKNKVLICHHQDEDKDAIELKKKLEEEGLEVKTQCVDDELEEMDDAEKEEIIDEICWTDTLVYIIGVDCENEETVDWEIEEAHNRGKKIVGVFGSSVPETVQIPKELNSFRDGLVNYDSEKVIKIVKTNTYYSNTPTGGNQPNTISVGGGEC